MNTRKCSNCKKEKNLDLFSNNKNRLLGKEYICKECRVILRRKHKEDGKLKKYRDANKEKINAHQRKFRKTEKGKKSSIEKAKRMRLKYPEKHSARIKLRYAVRTGKIIKYPCEVCGDIKSQGHHKDYSKPLDVIWLCDKHHKELHIQLKATGISI